MTLALEIPTVEYAQALADDPHNSFRIGQGSFRTAYHRTGDYWMYKYMHRTHRWSSDFDERTVNEWEMYYQQWITNSRDTPLEVRVPNMMLLDNNFIAAEYIEGEKPGYCWDRCHCISKLGMARCWYELAREISTKFRGLNDLHSDNVKIKDGLLYLIDIAGI